MPRNKNTVNREAPIYSGPQGSEEGASYGIKPGQVNAHPDGCPWKVPCVESPVCAYSRGFRSGFKQHADRYIEAGERFFCIHRKDGEHHRVCAGYHARGDGKFYQKKIGANDVNE